MEVFSRALPMVRDEALAEDVRGFIGQEAVHATSHQGRWTTSSRRAST